MDKIQELLLLATAITPITTGLVLAVKKALPIKKDYIPVMAIILGIGLGASASFIAPDIESRIWIGFISGLASVGLFEYTKIQDEYKDKNGGKK